METEEKDKSLTIRTAVPEDAGELLRIYRPYVEETAISFELEVPSVEEFRGRIQKVLSRYPYLVAEKNGKIAGYTYVSPFIGRAAYDWSVETSIYLDRDCRRQGIGRRLYESLEEILKEMHVLNVNACIGYPKEEDAYLTKNSARFHAHMGYTLVGRFHDSGYKFGRWYDMIWMEKMIGDHPEHPLPVVPFPKLQRQKAVSCSRKKIFFSV